MIVMASRNYCTAETGDQQGRRLPSGCTSPRLAQIDTGDYPTDKPCIPPDGAPAKQRNPWRHIGFGAIARRSLRMLSSGPADYADP